MGRLQLLHFVMLISAITAADPLIKTDDGQEFDMSYDKTTELVNMRVKVGANKYFSIGFGESMTDVNIYVFRAASTGCIVQDTFSMGHAPPSDTDK